MLLLTPLAIDYFLVISSIIMGLNVAIVAFNHWLICVFFCIRILLFPLSFALLMVPDFFWFAFFVCAAFGNSINSLGFVLFYMCHFFFYFQCFSFSILGGVPVLLMWYTRSIVLDAPRSIQPLLLRISIEYGLFVWNSWAKAQLG